MILNQRRFTAGLDFNNPGATQNVRPEVIGVLPLFRGGQDYQRREASLLGVEAAKLAARRAAQRPDRRRDQRLLRAGRGSRGGGGHWRVDRGGLQRPGAGAFPLRCRRGAQVGRPLPRSPPGGGARGTPAGGEQRRAGARRTASPSRPAGRGAGGRCPRRRREPRRAAGDLLRGPGARDREPTRVGGSGKSGGDAGARGQGRTGRLSAPRRRGGQLRQRLEQPGALQQHRQLGVRRRRRDRSVLGLPHARARACRRARLAEARQAERTTRLEVERDVRTAFLAYGEARTARSR